MIGTYSVYKMCSVPWSEPAEDVILCSLSVKMVIALHLIHAALPPLPPHKTVQAKNNIYILVDSCIYISFTTIWQVMNAVLPNARRWSPFDSCAFELRLLCMSVRYFSACYAAQVNYCKFCTHFAADAG